MILSHTLALFAGIAISGAARPVVGGWSDACEKLPPVAAVVGQDAAGWNGVFLLDRTESDDLETVAEQATSQLSRRARRRAGGKLRERLKPDECLRLSEDSSGITIESERGVLWRVSRDGNAETGPARGTGTRTLPATVTDSTITITASGERGQGRYELRRMAGGDRLELGVFLSAARLERPIDYTLVYEPSVERQPSR